MTAFCKKLDYYEIHQDKYPSFVDFYPEIISVFKDLSEKDLDEDFYVIPFTGTNLRFISTWTNAENSKRVFRFILLQMSKIL